MVDHVRHQPSVHRGVGVRPDQPDGARGHHKRAGPLDESVGVGFVVGERARTQAHLVVGGVGQFDPLAVGVRDDLRVDHDLCEYHLADTRCRDRQRSPVVGCIVDIGGGHGVDTQSYVRVERCRIGNVRIRRQRAGIRIGFRISVSCVQGHSDGLPRCQGVNVRIGRLGRVHNVGRRTGHVR